MEKVFFQLREFVIELSEGTVFGIGRLEPITKGWVVRMKGATDFEGEDGMLKAISLASKTTRKIAGAKDGDVELWDVVEVFEKEADATEAGHDNDQLYIFQIETGKLKWLID